MAVLGFIALGIALTLLGLLLKGGITLVTYVLVLVIKTVGLALGWTLSGLVWLVFKAWEGVVALYRLARDRRAERAHTQRYAAQTQTDQ